MLDFTSDLSKLFLIMNLLLIVRLLVLVRLLLLLLHAEHWQLLWLSLRVYHLHILLLHLKVITWFLLRMLGLLHAIVASLRIIHADRAALLCHIILLMRSLAH